jgi:hypothetical protein
MEKVPYNHMLVISNPWCPHEGPLVNRIRAKETEEMDINRTRGPDDQKPVHGQNVQKL